MAAIAIAIPAVVIAAFTAVADSLAGMITAESIASPVAVRAAVIRSAVTAACAATVATAVSAAPITATATAILCIGRIHDGQISREEWSGCEHHGAGDDSNETLVF